MTWQRRHGLDRWNEQEDAVSPLAKRLDRIQPSLSLAVTVEQELMSDAADNDFPWNVEKTKSGDYRFVLKT